MTEFVLAAFSFLCVVVFCVMLYVDGKWVSEARRARLEAYDVLAEAQKLHIEARQWVLSGAMQRASESRPEA